MQKHGDAKKYPEVFNQHGQIRPFGKQVLYGREINGLGMKFDTHLRAVPKGGKVQIKDGILEVTLPKLSPQVNVAAKAA